MIADKQLQECAITDQALDALIEEYSASNDSSFVVNADLFLSLLFQVRRLREENAHWQWLARQQDEQLNDADNYRPDWTTGS